MKYVLSHSGGKDSTAMLLMAIEKKIPLDCVVFCDMGMEFQAIYNEIDKITEILKKENIEYVKLKPPETFEYNMLDRRVNTRDGSEKFGYSWCGGNCRWGTSIKLRLLEQFYKTLNDEVTEYIGIAFDEPHRIDKKIYKNKIKSYPLVDWEMTEQDCLDYCYQNGIEWLEGDIRLYDILPRVSCWCCRNKNIKELRNYYHYLPEYFDKLKELQSKLRDPMKKDWSVFDLETRFEMEDISLEKGEKINTREFLNNVKDKTWQQKQ